MKSLLLVAVALTIACSPNNPKRTPPPEVNAVQQLDPGTLEVSAESKVDILFVVDDSRSMKKHQENLSRNIKLFSQAFEKNALIDFHIGVTTAWDGRLHRDDWNAEIKTHYGRIIDITPLGHLIPLKNPTSGEALTGPRYITKETPDLVKVLERTLLVGAKPGPDEDAPTVGPQYEELLSPARHVLFDSTKENAGFYRPDAFLVLFFITDANDASQDTNEERFYKDLVTLKGDISRVQAYAAITPTNSSCPGEKSGKPEEMEKFLDRFKNRETRMLNLCAPNFGAKLAQFGRDITEKMPEKVIIIPEIPAFGTLKESMIKVYYGSQLLRGRPEDAKDTRPVHYHYISGTLPRRADGTLPASQPHKIVLKRDWKDITIEKDAKIRIEIIPARAENLKNGRTRVF
jgi:hypothetical protein